jgi:hypothetical protein
VFVFIAFAFSLEGMEILAIRDGIVTGPTVNDPAIVLYRTNTVDAWVPL